MGVTHFPDGINAGSQGGAAASIQIGGTAVVPIQGTAGGVKASAGVTAITGIGTVSTGLATITGMSANLTVPPGTAGGSAAFVSLGTAAAGGLVINTWQGNVTTAGTVSQNVSWVVFGT